MVKREHIPPLGPHNVYNSGVLEPNRAYREAGSGALPTAADWQHFFKHGFLPDATHTSAFDDPAIQDAPAHAQNQIELAEQITAFVREKSQIITTVHNAVRSSSGRYKSISIPIHGREEKWPLTAVPLIEAIGVLYGEPYTYSPARQEKMEEDYAHLANIKALFSSSEWGVIFRGAIRYGELTKLVEKGKQGIT